MKLKKLLSLIFIIPLFCICLVGCKKSETSEQDSDDWIMVYEITFSYLFDGTSSSDYIETQTYTSYIEWTLNNTETTKEEYDSYPDNQGNSNTYLMGNQSYSINFTINKQSFLNEQDKKKNQFTIYLYQYKDIKYYKSTFLEYTTNYVKIKFLDNGDLLINFDNETKQIKTNYYNITYFNN